MKHGKHITWWDVVFRFWYFECTDRKLRIFTPLFVFEHYTGAPTLYRSDTLVWGVHWVWGFDYKELFTRELFEGDVCFKHERWFRYQTQYLFDFYIGAH